MPLFRNKPVTKEAHQLNDRNMGEILDWCGGESWIESGKIKGIKINTLEGVMACAFGDWVIKGLAGEFYPCRDDVFRKTYEEIPSRVQEG